MSERRFLVEFPSGSPVCSSLAETLQEGLRELERFRDEGGTLLILEPIAHMRVGGRLAGRHLDGLIHDARPTLT